MKQAVLFSVTVVGAMGIISLVGRTNTLPEPKVVGKDLLLWGFAAVDGTDVFRASLNESGSGFGSGSYNVTTRNILFIEKSGQARWLLPDHTHEVTEHAVARAEPHDRPIEPSVASFALVKPSGPDPRPGRLLLFDPAGHSVQEVAKDVMSVEATARANGEITVLYRLRTGYVLSAFQLTTLARLRDTPVNVPEIK